MVPSLANIRIPAITPASSSKRPLFEDEMGDLPALSSKTALFEDELHEMTDSSSKIALFEDGLFVGGQDKKRKSA
ncbi:MAG: hypothetical protein J6Y32_02350 [Bacteroidales bacterium]|nr:hypothetical protein [Bacteroidales bacterium]